MICGLSLALGGQALAQSSGATELVVTGSRIPTPNLTSSSPVAFVGQTEMKLQGTTNIENVLRDLPGVIPDGDNQTVNNSSAGISTIDLRGLGVQRTLVLLDGKRVQAADQFGGVDVNQFPSGMIDHVEVLTGGASSVYGGDAVSGVVNLISKKNFQGLEISSENSVTEQGDSWVNDVNFLVGVNSPDDKGNVTFFGDFMNRQATFQGARAFSTFALNSPVLTGCATPATLFGGFCSGGSPGIPEGRITSGAGAGNMFNGSRQLVPDDGHNYNFNPINYLQTPDTRYAFGAYGHYEIAKQLDFYTRATFAQNEAFNQLAETPVSAIFQVNFGNPNLSPQEQALLFPAGAGPYTANSLATFKLRRRLVENGPRVTHDTHDSYQLMTGFKGDLGSGWSYDVSGQYGRTSWTRILSGDADQVKFGNGLLVNPDGTCFSTDADCAPVDIFSTHSISPAAVNYFTVGAIGVGQTIQQDVQANVVGDLGQYGFKSPWSTSGIGVAFGLEYRRESSRYDPDFKMGHIGQLAGFGASPAIKGSYYTKEVYGEVRVPLVEDMPFMRSLQLEGGFRYSDYNRSGVNWSYKAAIEWAPVEDFRIRASYDRAVRDPTINELFAAATPSADTAVDPCASEGVGAIPYVTTAALCHATGVPVNVPFQDPSLDCGGQCNSHWLSNANLVPEQADTKSVGVVFTPRFIRGLSGSVDFYDIKIKKAIFRVPQPQVFQLCYDPAFNSTQSAANASCALIHRDAFGTLTTDNGFVDLAFANIGSQRAQGLDFVLDYKTPLSSVGLSGNAGTIGLNLTGTMITKSNYRIGLLTPQTNCLQLYGQTCGAPTPKWRHNLRLTWTAPGNTFSLSGRWRFISATKFDQVVQNGLVDPIDAKIGTFSYFDLSGTYRLNDKFDFNAGVRNVMDKDPPLVDINAAAAGFDSGNTFPGTYDTLGRVFFFGMTARF